MTRTGDPQSRLAALLDALEREILAAQPDEIRDTWHWTGRAREIALQEVRALLDEAIAASEEGPAATLLPDTCTGLGRLPGVPGELRPAARDHPRVSGAPAWSCRRH